jgi:hypothetical protein
VITLLSWLLTGVETIGVYVLWALETCVNAVGAAIVAAYMAALALLPSMPSVPSIGHPAWLDWLSWFYPVGDLLAGLTTMVTIWISFLAVRYVLKLVRGL